MRARLIAIALGLWLLPACGGARHRADEPRGLDEWRTVSEWILASPDQCVTGPFEIEVPAREPEFGRRFVVEVFGPRGLPLDSKMIEADGSEGSGWGWSEEGLGETLGDHSACRAGEEEGGDAGEHARRGSDDGAAATPGGTGGGASGAGAEARAELTPRLELHRGPLPEPRQQAGAIAWFPRGNPNYHAIDGIVSQYYEEGGRLAFRFQFWFHRPVDMDGVVVRIRDQLLVPTGPIDAYRAGFDGRVAEVRRRRAAAEGDEEQVARDPARGKTPPPPLAETVPEAPGEGVEWLPGYWRYQAELDDFLWVSGTFVVRGDEGEPNEAPTQAELEDEAPAARPVEARVPPQPAPREEVIPPPPAIAGAQWVPGHYRLDGAAWSWVAGRWQVPKTRGSRFHAPSIEVRGEVKLYVPGGWTLRVR